MFVMAKEPSPTASAKEIEQYYYNRTSPRDIADAFAIASNKYWWIEDEIYDFDENSIEYENACKIVHEWGVLMDKYKLKIFSILKKDGINIPYTGQITVLAPFMKKYGYDNKNGWWIKSNCP